MTLFWGSGEPTVSIEARGATLHRLVGGRVRLAAGQLEMCMRPTVQFELSGAYQGAGGSWGFLASAKAISTACCGLDAYRIAVEPWRLKWPSSYRAARSRSDQPPVPSRTISGLRP